MDRTATEQAIKICLTETHKLLKEAERIARTAVVCVDTGSPEEAMVVSENLGHLLHDAGRLHDAASLLNRLADA